VLYKFYTWKDDWKSWHDNLTEEEEKEDFLRRMRNMGFSGNTHEEALLFLDKIFPNNVRREILKSRGFY